MRRIGRTQTEPLYGVAATRFLEREVTKLLPAHTLMGSAGLATFQLATALYPHARSIWVACGPGNNGGDGLIAAMHLHLRFISLGLTQSVHVTLTEPSSNLPVDAAHALQLALGCGLEISDDPPIHFDLAIDALLGIGAKRTPHGRLGEYLHRLNAGQAPVVCVDTPSGLMADTGEWLAPIHPATQHPPTPRHTLSLLTLKPGLFTAQGRDAAGDIWLDDLGANNLSHRTTNSLPAPDARLYGVANTALASLAPHTSHKGSHGEVLVIGGQSASKTGIGMAGAAVLAARAALRCGAGRVYLCLLDADPSTVNWDPINPELMFRHPLTAMGGDLLERSAVVCGCGGGLAVAPLLPEILARARTLILDADALNAIAADPGLQVLLNARATKGWETVITPHPLEAARLLGITTQDVMADRLAAAKALSELFGVVCVLKGSGTVIHAPGETPSINASGNSALATAGTGDVLAGMVAKTLAARPPNASAFECAAQAVYHHGWLADEWRNAFGAQPLTADQLTWSRPPYIPRASKPT